MILAENTSRFPAPDRTTESGQWRLQLRGDELADIEYRGHPVLRAIRPVVRDHDWLTLAPAVESLKSDDGGTGFRPRLTVAFAGFGAEYTAELAVSVSGNDLTVDFDGTAPADFRSNRCKPSQTAKAPGQGRFGRALDGHLSGWREGRRRGREPRHVRG